MLIKQLTALLCVAFTFIALAPRSSDAVNAQISTEETIPAEATVRILSKTRQARKSASATEATEKNNHTDITTDPNPATSDSTEPTENTSINEYDVELLARLIFVEGGCEWFPSWVKESIGSVVLNRVASDLYPNTIEEVIYDPGQYEPDQLYLQEPDEEAFEIARRLLEDGSILPPDVLGQNGDDTGDGTYDTYYDEVLNSTIYFTYVYG